MSLAPADENDPERPPPEPRRIGLLRVVGRFCWETVKLVWEVFKLILAFFD